LPDEGAGDWPDCLEVVVDDTTGIRADEDEEGNELDVAVELSVEVV